MKRSKKGENNPKNIKKALWTFVVGLCMSMVMGGCATAYATLLRAEYREDNQVEGIYFGRAEYPRVYPATRIALCVEIPSWWCPGGGILQREYRLWMWPIGAPCSIVDLGLSIVTDTICVPYDYHMTTN